LNGCRASTWTSLARTPSTTTPSSHDSKALHIEGTIDNRIFTGRKTTPHVLVGNAKSTVINGSFIYGGNGLLVVVDKGAGASSFDGTITLTSTHLFGRKSVGAQPVRAIDLISGNGVTVDACSFDNVTTEYIKVRPRLARR
jgi:hypothetical protein